MVGAARTVDIVERKDSIRSRGRSMRSTSSSRVPPRAPRAALRGPARSDLVPAREEEGKGAVRKRTGSPSLALVNDSRSLARKALDGKSFPGDTPIFQRENWIADGPSRRPATRASSKNRAAPERKEISQGFQAAQGPGRSPRKSCRATKSAPC